MNHPHLEKVLQENRSFRIGHYISKGFHIFSKNLGSFVAFSLLSVFLMSIFGSLPLIGNWASQFVIVPVLMAGIYLVAHRINKGEFVEFGDHFMGFHYLVRLALASIAVSVITSVATIPFALANASIFEWVWSLGEMSATIDLDDIEDFMYSFPGFDAWKLLLLLPVIYLSIAYSWTKMFIIFFDLNVWDAMETSRQMISKNWLTYLLFSIILGIIGFGGIVGLGFGIFFTFPAMLCINYAAFEDMTQLRKAEADEDYVDILVK